MWANIPQLKLGNTEDIPQLLKPMDNKHNSLNLAVKICLDIFPWTLSVPRSSQFSLSFALEKLYASRNRAIVYITVSNWNSAVEQQLLLLTKLRLRASFFISPNFSSLTEHASHCKVIQEIPLLYRALKIVISFFK